MKATYPVLEIADVADLSSLYHPLVVLLVLDRRSTFGRGRARPPGAGRAGSLSSRSLGADLRVAILAGLW
jgi:hypothetical protein